LAGYADPASWFASRDEIKAHLRDHLKQQNTSHWLGKLGPAGYWCSDVLTWEQLLEHEAFKELQMIQHVQRENGAELVTTRCPIRIDGQIYQSAKGSPKIGEHNDKIKREFGGVGIQ